MLKMDVQKDLLPPFLQSYYSLQSQGNLLPQLAFIYKASKVIFHQNAMRAKPWANAFILSEETEEVIELTRKSLK